MQVRDVVGALLAVGLVSSDALGGGATSVGALGANTADDLSLVISPREGKPDGMAGTHALRTTSIALSDGRVVTTVAVIDGHAYAVGMATGHAARYSVQAGNATMPVRPFPLPKCTKTISGVDDPRATICVQRDDTDSVVNFAIPKIKGCDVDALYALHVPELANAISEAVMGRRCLGK
jgi:hypothetical protein